MRRRLSDGPGVDFVCRCTVVRYGDVGARDITVLGGTNLVGLCKIRKFKHNYRKYHLEFFPDKPRWRRLR